MASVIVDITNNVVTAATTPANLVTVASGGPQGPPGPSGSIHGYTGSAHVSGSIIVTGSIEITGSITASYFEGDGSSLINVTGSYVELINVVGSSSLATRLEDLEEFSSSLDTNFVSEAELAAATSSLSSSLAFDISSNSSSISNLIIDSSSFSTRVTDLENFSSSQYINDSSSFSTRITTNETDISNLQTDSGSFSTRITTNENSISNLQTDSSSFSTRITNQENFSSSQYNIESGSFSTRVNDLEFFSSSQYISDSSSFSTRVLNNETDISNLQTDSGSFSIRISTQENFSSSQYNAESSSFSIRVTDLENFSSSLDTNFVTEIELATATASLSSSFASTIGNIIDGDIITATSSLSLNVDRAAALNISSISASSAIFTSASIGFLESITGSAKIIGDAFIILNSDTPTERYAGISVYDTGSTLSTASFFFDGQTNDWQYEYSSSGGTDYAVTIFGPEFNTKGSPTYLTENRIPKAIDNHHLNDSNISDNGSIVSLNSNSQITGSLTVSGGIYGNVTGNLTGTASTASYAIFAQTATSASHALQTDLALASNIATSASHATQADLSLNSNNAISASHALQADLSISSSYVSSSNVEGTVATATSSSHALNADNSISSSFSTTSSLALTGNGIFSGSFSGSFQGDGFNLTGTLYEELVSGSNTYTITHNLNQRFPIVQTYNSSSASQVIPEVIQSIGLNDINIEFATIFEGYIIVKK